MVTAPGGEWFAELDVAITDYGENTLAFVRACARLNGLQSFDVRQVNW